MAGQRRKATLQDIADIVGMSRMSISRILNGKQQTSPEQEERIREAIAATGYRLNRAARALRQGSILPTIGLVVPAFADPACAAVAEAVAEVADEHGALLVVVRAGGEAVAIRAGVDALISRNVDGVLLCGPSPDIDVWAEDADRPVLAMAAASASRDELVASARSAAGELFALIDGGR